jgi:exodeoxyribonuclease VII large subunit
MQDLDVDPFIEDPEGETTEPTMSVSEFVKYVNGILKRGLGRGVWVQGEIESFNDRNKHLYFNVVERDGTKKATLNVAMWDGIHTKLRPLLDRHRLTLGDGIKVRLFGVADVWDVNGKFSFKVSNIDPRYTLGDLAGQRDEVIRQLREKGLYDANRQVELPLVPLRLALITSVGSAAHADTVHELTDSGIGFSITVHDVRVQGEGAVSTIVTALDHYSSRDDIDLVMVVRGGGSRTDLLAFDTLEVASAIGRCRKPVFVGVGHEIDKSVADEVAYRAFKTPTACAAGVVDVVQAYVERTESAWDSIADEAMEMLRRSEQALVDSAHSIRHRVFEIVRAGENLVTVASERIRRRPLDVVRNAAREIDAVAERVRLLDPKTTMARGWSITTTKDGRTVRSVANVSTGDDVVTHLADGTITSVVGTTTRHEEG